MKLIPLSIAAIVIATVHCTFVDLSNREATLRRHYRTILRYTTLHHLGPRARHLLTTAASRSDPIGDLAAFLLNAHEQVSQDDELRGRFAKFYQLMWQARVEQVREQLEQVWMSTLRDIQGIVGDGCKCKRDIQRFLDAQQRGEANVFGFRYGKGQMATRLLDNERACFLQKPELRDVLRRMELQLVETYLSGMPWRLRRVLRMAFRQEHRLLQNAINVPYDNNNATNGSSSQYISSSNNGTWTGSWEDWYQRAKSLRLRRNRQGQSGQSGDRAECVQKCLQSESGHDGMVFDDNQQQQQQQGEYQRGSEYRNRFVQWLNNVRSQLAQQQQPDQPQQRVVIISGDGTADGNNSGAQNDPLVGAVIEEEHQVIQQ